MALTNRYDFVLLFDVKDGNPNGDPDAGNLPRMDAETGRGLVTDVCLKRKIRDFVMLAKGQTKRFDIWVKSKSLALNEQIERAYEESADVKSSLESWKLWQNDKKNNPKPTRHYEDIARDWMCDNFYDIRTFGAVMSTSDKDTGEESSKIKKTAGQVRGPVQITFSRSVDPIVALEHSITVCAPRKGDKPAEDQIGIQGRKFTVPYGLYAAHGFVSSFLAKQTGFDENDLELLWQALAQMFEHDRSAARGEMTTRGLYVFKHDSELGNAPAHSLFARIQPKLKDSASVPRDFSDYDVSVNEDGMPLGVTIERRI
ncbi:MAG: type I-C CRISPR-associated protein Cas7/Csd2 [Rhodocyclaceae bacterium]|nr:type I-C CRISPR-associated protein Cas7/Csd2 [Rhodocyclaceae bacterium]